MAKVTIRQKNMIVGAVILLAGSVQAQTPAAPRPASPSGAPQATAAPARPGGAPMAGTPPQAGRPATPGTPSIGATPQFGGMPSFGANPLGNLPGAGSAGGQAKGKSIGKIDDEYIYKTDDNKYTFDKTDPNEPPPVLAAPVSAPAFVPTPSPTARPGMGGGGGSGKPNPFKPANKAGSASGQG